jgi:hypothetical protein
MGEVLGPTVDGVDPCTQPEGADGPIGEGDPTSLGIEQGDLEIGPGGGDDQPRHSPTATEVQHRSVDLAEGSEEALRVADVVLHRPGAKGAEPSGLVQDVEQCVVGGHRRKDAHALVPVSRQCLFHVEHVGR